MPAVLTDFLVLVILALASKRNADQTLDGLALLAQNTSEAVRKLRQGLELLEQAVSEARKLR
ncbi:hypothetical protein [Desulfothermobacter acidiphilus]|uniref:hypothetical protein n=1 Tax=Desulfothermobacter acidiphilus TaxID=1938353 RepID=UPI003F8A0D75